MYLVYHRMRVEQYIQNHILGDLYDILFAYLFYKSAELFKLRVYVQSLIVEMEYMFNIHIKMR